MIAFHPRLARIGDACPLEPDRAVDVGRLEPLFGDMPLDDPFVSRKPISIALRGGKLDVKNPHGVDVRVVGDDLILADRVVLRVDADAERPDDDLGLAGWSGAMRSVRDAIRLAARGQGPVLVRGETGTGKELVARAIHAIGPRPNGPFVAVNLAAIPSAVAPAELFGHDKGAFTGAAESRRGYFERAHGGTLFLDEIGELADDIQPVLLRALDAGEIQPVGATATRTSDARVVTATDADLEHAVATGELRAALFHRLGTHVIELPPLRARGLDVAILFARFAGDRDSSLEATPWLSGSLAAELFRAPLPGNVRQLRSLVARAIGLPRVTLEALGDVLDDPDEPPPAAATDIDDDQLREVLRAHRFQLASAARALGISRMHLDARIAKSSTLRKAKDLTVEDIATCRRNTGGDLDVMAAALEVSPRGLKLRMTQLGLD